MKVIRVAIIGTLFNTIAVSRPTFSGNFIISNLIVNAPWQSNHDSDDQSYVVFDFADQDTPVDQLAHCQLDWRGGSSPESGEALCDNSSYGVSIDDSLYSGVDDFIMTLSHQYTDDSIGEWPYNMLTKYGNLTMAYPKTVNYECNMELARCQSCNGTSLTALVTQAVG